MVYRDAEEVREAKAKTPEAVALAMECKWEEAAGVNREIIEFSPDDLDAWNRLGKALLELGDAKGSRAAFEHTLTIDPSNTIARKNIERLSLGSYASSIGGAQADRRMFNGDSGKSAQVALMGVTAGKGRLYLAPGGAIDLRPNNGNLTVFSSDGRFVGIVPPQLGRRLVLLMEAGNRYDGAIASTTADAVKVVLRESYQHPSQRSKVSFPSSSVAAPQQPLQEAPLPPLDISFVDDDDADVLEAAGVGVGMLLGDGQPDEVMFEDIAEEA
ncbi:MAG: hypothetical protein O3B65_00525 [Chloroflexi bacterium]|nr:hypothetical protein [Chloroflexota bacterium]